jgi:ATP-binding cassette, subfamily B, multidrug efflux pump
VKDFHDDKLSARAYDSRLMKRLLLYARPYWKILILTILLLLITTVIDLSRPYLIKIAIDDHINLTGKILLSFETDKAPENGIIFQDRVFIRKDKLRGEYPEAEQHQIINYQGDFFLIKGFIKNDNNLVLEETDTGKYYFKYDNKLYHAINLDKNMLKKFRHDDINALINISIIFLILIFSGLILNYIQVYLLNYASQKTIYTLRQDIFSHLQKMSLRYFDSNPIGKLVTRVSNDTENINEMYTNVLVFLFKDIFLIIGIIIIMLRLHLKLALVTFSVLPLVFLTSFIFRRYVREAYRDVRSKLAKINASLSEDISGIKIIQIFNQEKRKLEEFININTEYYKATLKQIHIFAIFRPTMDLFYSLILALIIWYGGARVLNNTLNFGVLYAFINYLQQFFNPINDLSEKYDIIQSAMASSERIFMIIDTEEEIKNPHSPLNLPDKLEGKVEFKNVSFAYKENEWVLKDINFKINPGETVAIVGATGAGKSSIINLLSRFYDIQKGEILIDNINITNINKQELRKHIGVVLQDVFLFTGDINSNIGLNAEEISEEVIKKSASYVNADQFISRLEGNYKHRVKERGASFSAGQRQLLAFARALAFNPDILVLDEATANIDTETESLIQDALKKLSKDRTTIIIAHRLSTISNADKIIVLHKGKIMETGKHNELLNKGGLYYDLYQLQYKDQLDTQSV